jgi:hypothetical protein
MSINQKNYEPANEKFCHCGNYEEAVNEAITLVEGYIAGEKCVPWALFVLGMATNLIANLHSVRVGSSVASDTGLQEVGVLAGVQSINGLMDSIRQATEKYMDDREKLLLVVVKELSGGNNVDLDSARKELKRMEKEFEVEQAMAEAQTSTHQ